MPIRSTKRAAFAENTTPYVSTIKNADGAQSSRPIGPAVGSAQRLLVYQLGVKSAGGTALHLPVRLGFGASALPAESANGTPGMLLEGSLAPGESTFASPGIGLPGQRLLLTCDEPAGVNGKLWVSFYCELIEV